MAKKRLQKWLAFCLALSMLMGTTAMAVDAPEQPTGLVEVETRGGEKETVEVVIEIGQKGEFTETAENFKTENGAFVDYEGKGQQNADGTGSYESEYTVDKGKYSAEGGSEIVSEKVSAGDITVKVPLSSEEGKNENTAYGDAAGTILDITDDKKETPWDGEYDYTQIVVKEQSSVSAETKDITITEIILPKEESKTDLDYTFGTAAPDKEKDLFNWIFRGSRTELPKEGDVIEGVEGYDYKYIGAGNSSQILPTFLFNTPDPSNPNEEPVYIDAEGNKYYKHSYGCLTDDEYYYRDGERVEVEGTFPSIFGVPQQFVLVDVATGETITTYCADFETSTVKGYNYNIENLEDADYYSDEQAAMIRTITKNGYWGVEGTEIDENGNEVPAEGSLEAMKASLLASGEFTAEELEYLTDGVALAATQMSIWKFSNAMSGVEYFSAVHTKDSNANNEIATQWAGSLLRPDNNKTEINESAVLTEDEQKSVDMLYKLYDYLTHLAPTAIENPTTTNTVINADNFLKDMAVTVVDKVKDHENNQDEDDTNDAYTTDISFALVVTPSTENGDDLIVRVYGSDMTTPIAEGRIAGEGMEGENMLYADANGNYTFKGITMIEGDQNFNITLEGVQNLEEGVYLYTSEVRTDEDGEETSSQTLVGKAEGKRDVNVSMNIRFELDVEDEIVATERYWRNERIDGDDDDDDDDDIPGDDDDDDTPKGDDDDDDDVTEIGDDDVPQSEFPGDDDDDDDTDIPEDDVPLEELPEDDVPLAEVPKTGDASILWFALSALSGAGLVGLNLTKKREDEE